MASESERRVGDYEILAAIGSGGMGRVFKVRNVISNREEAMKVLLPDVSAEPELAARFMAEIRTLGALDHPNIAQLRTAFQLQNQFVMVMEYVEGITLESLAAQSRIPLDRVLDYSAQALAALSYAHGLGVIHRDIKPANIMVTTHGVVKLMDFGIAKSANEMHLTRPGTTMGSVYYMSPEQVCGGAIDARSDIYSFGVTLYEMLTGRKPFQSDTSYTVLNAHMNEAPIPPLQVDAGISQQLSDTVMRSLMKNPDERFQTADDFRSALKEQREPLPAAEPVAAYAPAIAEPAPQSAAQPPAFTPVPPPAIPATSARKSNRTLWLVLGAVTAVIVLAATATVLPRVFATHAGQGSTAATASAPVSPPAPDPVVAPAVAEPPTPTASPSQSPMPTGAPTLPSGAPPVPKDGTPIQPKVLATSPNRQPYVRPTQSAVARESTIPSAGPPSAAIVPASAGPSPQEIRQSRDRLMNLDARAETASDGLKHMRSQQQAQGLDMRGDILASMSRMQTFLTEANRAVEQKDLQAAAEYMDRADVEVSKLEAFLGR